ncbi:MAG: hemin-binding protein, partial [Prevotella sp.]|nr:hemin-binding protein [Prevotella sp.]
LTADQLSGTTSEWKQTNYYYQYSSSTLPTEPNLAQFGSGGKNGKSSVFLTFNDVMIGSSYSSAGKNQASTIAGSDNAVLGTVYEGTHTVKMPTKETLKNAIQNDKVFANVLIISNETGEILNAARVKVMTQEESNGISELNADNRAEVARYSLDGRRLNAPQKGVNIVKFNDGKTQKVVVK